MGTTSAFLVKTWVEEPSLSGEFAATTCLTSPSHAMYVDQKDESCYVPLNDSLKAQGKLELANSRLTRCYPC